MTSIIDSEDSQESKELENLVASRRPELTDRGSPNPHSSDSPQSEHDIKPRQYTRLGLGQGQPVSQLQPYVNDEDNGSQKENYSSADSSTRQASALCPSNENALSRPIKSMDKSRASSRTSPIPVFQSATFNSRSNPNPTSGSFQGFSDSVSSPGNTAPEPVSSPDTLPSRSAQPFPEASQPEMLDDTYGTNTDIVNRWKTRPTSCSPTKRQVEESQSQDSQGEMRSSQDGVDEVQAQIVSQYELDHSISMSNSSSFDGTQTQTQATQSTQPIGLDDVDAVDDREWRRYTGIQVPKHLREKYLEPAKIGAGAEAFRRDDYYDDDFPGSSTPATRAHDHQYPAGTPDPSFSDQEVATQLIGGSQQEVATQLTHEPGEIAEEDNEAISIQYPAGFAPRPEDEGMETQIATQIESQLDGSSIVAHANNSLSVSNDPSLPEAPSSGLASFNVLNPNPSSARSSDIVPDSEPPAPSPRHSTSVAPASPQMQAESDSLKRQPDAIDVDSDDDEDDRPLASIVSRVTSRKAGSAAPMPPPLSKRSENVDDKRQVAVDEDDFESVTEASTRMLTPVSDVTYIPSQVSDEADSFAKKTGRGPKVKAKGKARANTLQTPASSNASILRKSTRSTRNRYDMAESDFSDEEAAKVKGEDSSSKPDDEEYMTPAPATTGGSSRKRKRNASSVPRKLFKEEPSSSKRTPSLQPAPVKVKNPARVLALWTDGHWYCGSIAAFIAPDTYEVAFDDGSKLKARIGSLRILDLRLGDEVKVIKTRKMGKVVELKGEGQEKIVSVAVGGRVSDLACYAFCIPADSVETQWRDRMLNSDLLEEIEGSTAQYELPENADSFFSGCGIIVTIKDATEHSELHNEICTVLAENGASLIEDWTDCLTAQGSYTSTSWTINKKDVRWFEDLNKPNSVRRVFVVADAESTKPKYLIGLALGVPCLSSHYLLDGFAKRKGEDWNPFLLPRGTYNSPLFGDIRLSQSINLQWGSKPEHLANIMDNPTASKLFEGQSILCVGENYIPEREKCDSTRVNVRKISRAKVASGEALVILAMGASQVTAVANLNDAPKKEHFDYVVFKQIKASSTTCTPKGRTTYVSWDWVKQSLIRGEMLPVY
ncbi:hypothetical protein GYMLUDRAFT_86625 [Collybiopsis luxurians FD-317 M1]|uniref:Tudor domain-containing protein n=1 Tax=Collybiopsis luxurians FD-317 M1 TaxID=944289 RepID=A0A0D0B391_9AGAR|nr:hypothetical protein GYMLUDRAFT_86625 [Collybiopsis luxurians FD-317 M1]